MEELLVVGLVVAVAGVVVAAIAGWWRKTGAPFYVYHPEVVPMGVNKEEVGWFKETNRPRDRSPVLVGRFRRQERRCRREEEMVLYWSREKGKGRYVRRPMR